MICLSKYTTTLRWIVDFYCQDITPPPLTLNDKLQIALPKIFSFDFPIYDESHRETLERKIVLHYFNHEICAETVQLWKLFLEEQLNLIMPQYNELYKTLAWKYEPLTDVSFMETMERQTKHDREGQSQGTTASTQDDSYSNTVDRTGKTVTEEQTAGSGTKDTQTQGTSSSDTTTSGTMSGNDKETGHGTEAETTSGTTTGQTKLTGTSDETNETSSTQKTVSSGSRDLTERTDTTTDTTGNSNRTTNSEAISSDYPQAEMSKSGWATTGNRGEGTETEQHQENVVGTNKHTANETTDGTQNITASGSGSTERSNNETTNTTGDSSGSRDVTKDNTITKTASETRSGTEHTDTETSGTGKETSISKGTLSGTEDTSGNETGSGESARKLSGTSENQTSETGTEDMAYILKRSGLTGNRSYISLIREYREAIINVDRMIIEELYDLFMLIY